MRISLSTFNAAALLGALFLGKAVAAAVPANCRATTTNVRPEEILQIIVVDPKVDQPVYWKKYGQVYDSFVNVPAYSNVPFKGSKYQCTELLHRFFNYTYGFPVNNQMGLGNANTVLYGVYRKFQNYTAIAPNLGQRRMRLAYFQNGCSPYAPVVGSAISLNLSWAGHAGIVRRVKQLAPDTIELTLFEQHGFRRLRVGQLKEKTTVVLKRNAAGLWYSPQLKSQNPRDINPRAIAWLTPLTEQPRDAMVWLRDTTPQTMTRQYAELTPGL